MEETLDKKTDTLFFYCIGFVGITLWYIVSNHIESRDLGWVKWSDKIHKYSFEIKDKTAIITEPILKEISGFADELTEAYYKRYSRKDL